MSYQAELRSYYQEGRLIPFIGAGVSMSVEWKEGAATKRGPSWEELVDEAARDLGFEIPDLLRVRGTDIQILEYFKIKKRGETASLKNWLFRSMQPPDDALRLSPIHRELAMLKKCNLFYTTNFDDFIERAFKLGGFKFQVQRVNDGAIVHRLPGAWQSRDISSGAYSGDAR